MKTGNLSTRQKEALNKLLVEIREMVREYGTEHDSDVRESIGTTLIEIVAEREATVKKLKKWAHAAVYEGCSPVEDITNLVLSVADEDELARVFEDADVGDVKNVGEGGTE